MAVVTDGSAVLGLGNLGAMAALPVMEGKAALFKRFAGIDAFPICLDTQDVDEIVRTVELIAPVFAGINLEDISAPRCFEVERRLRASLDIPVFHDDQHGTAIVVLAALINALKVVGKDLADVRIVLSGAGAAGMAILAVLLEAGAQHVVVSDKDGVIHAAREGLAAELDSVAERTNVDGRTGALRDVLPGADVFIGVSAPNILTGEDIRTMAEGAIVFALANPVPEVDPVAASEHAAVVASGRSDLPNQINNVLAFPGVFRGLLDAASHSITLDMLLAAARALADVVTPDELNAELHRPQRLPPRRGHRGGRGCQQGRSRVRDLGGPGPGRAARDARSRTSSRRGAGAGWSALAVAVAVNLVILFWPRPASPGGLPGTGQGGPPGDLRLGGADRASRGAAGPVAAAVAGPCTPSPASWCRRLLPGAAATG